MSALSHAELTAKLVAFLQQIGLSVRAVTLEEKSFLPGITFQDGGLVYDPERLLYPGDLLHEAGHLALLKPEVRAVATDEIVGGEIGLELGAIAWSYAAIRKLELPAEILFHPAGYKGKSQSLIFNFSMGVCPGLTVLESAGMAVNPRFAAEKGVAPYPEMLHWLRP